MVADYFASEELSKNWLNNINLLDSDTFDDAWLFASSNIHHDQLKEYLLTISDKDLILACSCAIESGKKGIEIIEPIVLNNTSNKAYSKWIYSNAMTILKTDNCIDYLKRIVYSDNKDIEYEKQSLVKIGYEPLISEIFEIAERETSMPLGFNISSGNINLWSIVPINIKLKFAREKLKNRKDKDNFTSNSISIRTIAALGTPDDFIFLKESFEKQHDINEKLQIFFYWYVLEPEKSLNSVYDKLSAIYEYLEILFTNLISILKVINKISHNIVNLALVYITIYFLKEIRERNIVKARIFKALIQINQEVDYDWIYGFLAFNFDLSNTLHIKKYDMSNLYDERLSYIDSIRDRLYQDEQGKILKVLLDNKIKLDQDKIKQHYLNTEGRSKERFFEIASFHNFNNFDSILYELINSDQWRKFIVGDFALKRPQLDNEVEFLNKAISIIENNTDKFFTDGYLSLLNFLLHRNKIDLVSKYIKLKLNDLIIRNEKLGINIINDDLSFKFCKLLPYIVKISDLLEKGIIFKLMRFDYMACTIQGLEKPPESLIKILNNLSPKEIDENLIEIKNSGSYLIYKLLPIISEIGATILRIKLVEEFLSKFIKNPIILGYLLTSIKNMWGDDMCKSVVKGFLNCEGININKLTEEISNLSGQNISQNIVEDVLDDLEIDSNSEQFRHITDLDNFMLNNVNKNMAEKYILPALNIASNPKIKEILQGWYDFGINRR